MQVMKYFTPKTLEEAYSLLSDYKEKAKVIAGGTDLLAQIKHGEVLPGYIINIKGISGQDYIIYDREKGLSIGALTTIRSIETSLLIQEKFSILAQAASKLGTRQVRNQGAIGGNLCNAAPSAETAPALIGLSTNTLATYGSNRGTGSLDFSLASPVVRGDKKPAKVNSSFSSKAKGPAILRRM